MLPPPLISTTSIANATEVHKRFVKVSQENIFAIKENIFEEKTAKSTKWGVKIFKDWLAENDLDIDFQFQSVIELDALLARFYVEVRKVDGSYYSKPSYVCLRAAIQRYLQNPPYNLSFCILKDAAFLHSNQVLKGMFKTLTEQGLTMVNHFKHIEKEDMNKLINTGVIGTDNPRSLLNLVWLSIAFQFGKRGRESYRGMTKSTFIRGIDAAGLHYYEYGVCEKQKNHSGKNLATTHVPQGRMYERKGDPLCPVSAMDKYLSHLHPDLDSLWQTPNSRYDFNENKWYINSPIGENTLANMMKNMSKAAGLTKVYTNHCTRDTVSKNQIL